MWIAQLNPQNPLYQREFKIWKFFVWAGVTEIDIEIVKDAQVSRSYIIENALLNETS